MTKKNNSASHQMRTSARASAPSLLAPWMKTKRRTACDELDKRLKGATELCREDLILAVLDFVGADRHNFEQEAAKRGITLNQLIAAAIVGGLRDYNT